VKFITDYKQSFGVEPICQTLEVAPSTYYAALRRPASARRVEDERLKVEVKRVRKGEPRGLRGLQGLATVPQGEHRRRP
jgi:putative transposase